MIDPQAVVELLFSRNPPLSPSLGGKGSSAEHKRQAKSHNRKMKRCFGSTASDHTHTNNNRHPVEEKCSSIYCLSLLLLLICNDAKETTHSASSYATACKTTGLYFYAHNPPTNFPTPKSLSDVGVLHGYVGEGASPTYGSESVSECVW